MILAHGIGTRGDLPLPIWLFAYGAGFAVLISFAALRLLWPRPRLASAARGAAVPRPLDRVARILLPVTRAAGLLLWFGALAAGLVGDDDPARNVAPVAVYVVVWVAVPVASLVLGDVWAALNPFDTLAVVGRRLRGRPPGAADEAVPASYGWGAWPAVAGIASFVWLELAYHTPSSPRAVGTWMALYSAATIAGTCRWGRGWLRRGDGFTVLFGLIGSMGLLFRDDRLRVRPPFTGLATVVPVSGMAALVLVTLGSTSFDGLTRTEFWLDVLGDARGWELTALSSMGLVWIVGVVALFYLGAMRMAARTVGGEAPDLAARFLHSLIPIVLAYALGHYFSLLVFEGQTFLELASDPFGAGWDLFGTADWSVDFRLLSAGTIAYVQAISIAGGHVAGVVAAHDRAVELWPHQQAVASQYPLLVVMVAYTVGGLLLLLGA